ncbi:T6SS immunity protein Tdi1 domain-containing protein [Roseimicrobium sp. ORNL1]|uniref:T6SS immunity protein Tdi1 domain-containing protein n=1 Tax=Roseimicrobium sp. ORNL1 TaxID=2711231 RepID=UPI0013E1F389|nr:T6SS immunity protein Tdi1 domain-containing protein [Roseimicrobium sp. ORNL1]QIE99986.1 DUF1851 domain-containing protein [Roseimicrobium sp. ORNL1]
MILDRFQQFFVATAGTGDRILPSSVDFGVQNLARIFDELGGKTFNHGLYRVFHPGQLPVVTEAIEGVFPEYRGRIVPFGYDWLGRHFACDRARTEDGEPQVLMLEIGAGEAMEIPASALDFHNIELVEYTDEALAAPFWSQWRSLNPTDLAFGDCVGYKVPLFLGGADDLTNLEVIDLSVYVEICGQLRNKVRTLPPGQSIRRISFAE